MKRLVSGVFCAVFASAGAFAAGPQQGAVAVKTAKAKAAELKAKLTLAELEAARYTADRILVESGLAADETFVTAGTHKLRDGAAVAEQ